jgi:hypothetical protein
MPPMHKARAALSFSPSAPLNGIAELFDKPLLLWRETLVCRGSCKSPPQAEIRVHLQPHHAQLRKKRNKSKKEPVWRSSTGASGSYPDDRLEDRGGTRLRFGERVHL